MDIQRFISHLEHQEYFDRRLELARRVEPGFSRFLYKYRAVEYRDPVAMDRLRAIFVRSRLWLSSSDDFNDPFDMSAHFIISKGGLVKRKRFEKLAKSGGLKRKATLVGHWSQMLRRQNVIRLFKKPAFLGKRALSFRRGGVIAG
jgi:hypothetical protein